VLKTIQDNIPARNEEEKKHIDKAISKGVDIVHKKNSEVLKTVDAIINNPVANITASIAGPDVKKRVEQVQEIVKEAKSHPLIVGNHKFNMVPKGSKVSMQPGVMNKGPPVVSVIQALDQYGNVIA
jgi:hypothetical protein